MLSLDVTVQSKISVQIYQYNLILVYAKFVGLSPTLIPNISG